MVPWLGCPPPKLSGWSLNTGQWHRDVFFFKSHGISPYQGVFNDWVLANVVLGEYVPSHPGPRRSSYFMFLIFLVASCYWNLREAPAWWATWLNFADFIYLYLCSVWLFSDGCTKIYACVYNKSSMCSGKRAFWAKIEHCQNNSKFHMLVCLVRYNNFLSCFFTRFCFVFNV